MKFRQYLQGLYPVTDPSLQQNLAGAVHDTLQGGARVIQYRDKGKDPTRRLNEALQLKQLCLEHEALLIINDDIQLAKESNADGVHLGANDPDILEARHYLGDRKIIGISCYNQLSLAIAAQQQGANYAAFGSFYLSSVKPNAIKADIHLLSEARQQLDIPIVAIGGITLHNAPDLVAAGADMLAVINGVFAQKAIQSTTEKFNALYSSKRTGAE
ncbi:Thiamin-phosphate pyrophosphorylase [hydrothermal vent metagenome]|uniref:thiamine phosphate synthase n=1 Tax=hydrothermal vent metagenome TaxID=652676 RepID=A0A3B0YLD7_9ZZZZ